MTDAELIAELKAQIAAQNELITKMQVRDRAVTELVKSSMEAILFLSESK